MEYQRSRRIQASPDDVFAFVSEFNNLPNYVPTIQSVETLDEGRVRLHGKVGDSSFDDEGWIRVDHNQRGLEWGADTRDYHGWMTVTGADDDATQVVTHLSLTPHVNQDGRPLTGERPDEPDPIEAGLEASMDSLRNILEGTGGKEQPSVTST